MQDHSNGQDANYHNVYNLFSGKTLNQEAEQSITHICAESSGLRMLYATPFNPERLIAVPLLCWGIRVDGEVVGMVPWIDEVTDCTNISDKLDVSWEGYYDEISDEIFYHAPEIIVAQLTAMKSCQAIESISYHYASNQAVADDQAAATTDDLITSASNQTTTIDEYEYASGASFSITQEIADVVGTHALMVNPDQQSLMLTPIVSWVLDQHGQLHGMVSDEDASNLLPVIPGDDCLYTAASNPNFRCFFQRDIVEQIRTHNPETLAAIEQLLSC